MKKPQKKPQCLCRKYFFEYFQGKSDSVYVLYMLVAKCVKGVN